jgi:crossover junction endodeoxyribonuclease RuvC
VVDVRILGIDPGLTRCGIGIVERSGGRQVSLVHVEVVRTPASDEPYTRLLAVADRIEAVIGEFVPDVVAVERVFAQANVRSIMGTAQAAGVAMVSAARAGLPLGMHTPSEVKAAVTGSGRADKKQVQEMVRRILTLSEVAICHAWRGNAAGTSRAQHGGAGMLPDAGDSLTPAQRAWAEAERLARRSGAVAPRG